MKNTEHKMSWSLSESIEQMPACKLIKIAEVFGKDSNEFKLAEMTYQAQTEFEDTEFAKLKASNRAMLHKRGF